MGKPAIWYGVYSEKGSLKDVTPGEFHAEEIRKERSVKQGNHRVARVLITEIEETVNSK